MRKIEWLLDSNGFRFSPNLPKYDENNAGKIKVMSVSATTASAGKNTA